MYPIFKEEIPVISASLFCICVKKSLPPLDIFLSSSKVDETPSLIKPPLIVVAGGCSCKVFSIVTLVLAQTEIALAISSK